MAAPQPFIQFEVAADRGFDVVGAILDAHLRRQAVRRLRIAWVHVLALLGGTMALGPVAPAALPAWIDANLPLAWALCFGAAAVAAVGEWTWDRRRQRLIDESSRSNGHQDP
ncbi:MAG: hypothetical protein IT294_04670 [Deltaproteobacteria bacterium]|nr:hypothetical protein [Deltaproteobacteria bacterium]